MTSTDWLWILHPALAVIVIYPLRGMVLRLAWSIRRERSSGTGRPHGELGRWLATLQFCLQGITGTRDLLEIPLSWQKPAVYACDFAAKTCPPPAQGAS